MTSNQKVGFWFICAMVLLALGAFRISITAGIFMLGAFSLMMAWLHLNRE